MCLLFWAVGDHRFRTRALERSRRLPPRGTRAQDSPKGPPSLREVHTLEARKTPLGIEAPEFKGNQGGPKEGVWNIGQCEGLNVERIEIESKTRSNQLLRHPFLGTPLAPSRGLGDGSGAGYRAGCWIPGLGAGLGTDMGTGSGAKFVLHEYYPMCCQMYFILYDVW